MSAKRTHHYVESGLDNVMIHNFTIHRDDAEDETITIPNVLGLHKAIATALVAKTSSLTGKELRFLRAEMGMTQAELAALVHREPLAISRWERGEVAEIDQNAEALIRLHAREALKLKINAKVKEIAGFTMPSAITPQLAIDGSDPSNYRIMPEAA
jgi:transcriptional regulator with XRE-family HTH domain